MITQTRARSGTIRALYFGMRVLCGTLLQILPVNSSPARPPTLPTPRVVLGLKEPLTPQVMRELKGIFQGRLLNAAPGNSYVLLILRPGETAAQVQARSPRIAFVDPEIVMGVAEPVRENVLLIPAPRIAPPARRPLGRVRP